MSTVNHITLSTEDGQSIACNHYRADHSAVLIIAHGFYNNKDTVLFKGISEALSESFDILCFDFRGHGSSGGWFSWTAHEEHDLRAVVNYAEQLGYEKIGVIGFSLGAAIAIIEASKNRSLASVMAVSAPSDVYDIDFHFWEPEMVSDLLLNIGPKGRGKSVRPGNPFLNKISPKEIVKDISPTPIAFLHGADDWLIKAWHSEVLYAHAVEPKKLRIIENAGHAEKIFDGYPDVFIHECVEWFTQTLA